MYNFKLTPIEHCGQRVLTTAQLAEAYETENKIISNNFNRNKNRYIEGKHFYKLMGDDVENFCVHHFDEHKNHSKIRILYLWTEKGAGFLTLYGKPNDKTNNYSYYVELYDKNNLNSYCFAIVKSTDKETALKIAETAEIAEE